MQIVVIHRFPITRIDALDSQSRLDSPGSRENGGTRNTMDRRLTRRMTVSQGYFG